VKIKRIATVQLSNAKGSSRKLLLYYLNRFTFPERSSNSAADTAENLSHQV